MTTIIRASAVLVNPSIPFLRLDWEYNGRKKKRRKEQLDYKNQKGRRAPRIVANKLKGHFSRTSDQSLICDSSNTSNENRNCFSILLGKY